MTRTASLTTLLLAALVAHGCASPSPPPPRARIMVKRPPPPPPPPPRTVHKVGRSTLPEKFAIDQPTADAIAAYRAKLDAIHADSPIEDVCEVVDMALALDKAIYRVLDRIRQEQGDALFDGDMPAQVADAAEVFNEEVPGVYVGQGEALSLHTLLQPHDWQTLDFPPSVAAAFSDPLIAGDRQGNMPHHVYMTDSQICTSVKAMDAHIEASAKTYREMPTCLRKSLQEHIGFSIDTVSRGCFCDDQAAVKSRAAHLAQHLAAFDDIGRYDGTTRSEVFAAVVDKEDTAFDGKCNF